jgi:hypothetical protein
MSWTDFFREISTEVFGAIGIVLVLFLPLILLAFVLNRRRKIFREQSLEPFTDMPLRPPGESLRTKIEELSEEYDAALTISFIAGMGAVCMVLASPPSRQLAMGLIFGGITFCVYTNTARVMFRTQRSLWDYRLGFTGERVVGELLNQLLAEGFQVFHDLPFEGFNIDHVIVGPPGVYAVETKARRKPTEIKGQAKAKVFYDGAVLKFPRHQETEPIEQARLNAKTLAKWLTQSTGEHTSVNAIVALPGWWVERTGRSDVNVLNPKEIISSFPNRPVEPLTPDRIQRIAHQLTERCRMAKPN